MPRVRVKEKHSHCAHRLFFFHFFSFLIYYWILSTSQIPESIERHIIRRKSISGKKIRWILFIYYFKQNHLGSCSFFSSFVLFICYKCLWW